MVQRLKLSLGEVEFLLTQADDGSPARDVLGIQDDRRRLAGAGLSSLVARGLATAAPDGLMLSPDLRGAAAVLLRPRVWVGVVRQSDEGSMAMLFGAPADGPSSLITLAGFGCLEFSVLSDSMGAAPQAFGTLVQLMLAPPGTKVEIRLPISGDVARLSVSHGSDDTWALDEAAGVSPASRESVIGAASDLVEQALAAA